jgi:hypothetical protein
VIASGNCGVTLNIIDQQTANWSRDQAQNLMTNWLSTASPFDAVIANNDEMAIGAIQAMNASGIAKEDVIVGGIDATADALKAMEAGELDVTVFQDAAGQGKGALDAALALARGEAAAGDGEVDRIVAARHHRLVDRFEPAVLGAHARAEQQGRGERGEEDRTVDHRGLTSDQLEKPGAGAAPFFDLGLSAGLLWISAIGCGSVGALAPIVAGVAAGAIVGTGRLPPLVPPPSSPMNTRPRSVGAL